MTRPGTKSAKTVAKTSYSLVGDLHGIQGAAVQIRLAPLIFASNMKVFCVSFRKS